MLLDKNIRKICAFCLHGSEFGDGEILCAKKGPMPQSATCRKFRYDPMQRIPLRGVKLKKPDDDAFKLD